MTARCPREAAGSVAADPAASADAAGAATTFALPFMNPVITSATAAQNSPARSARPTGKPGVDWRDGPNMRMPPLESRVPQAAS